MGRVPKEGKNIKFKELLLFILNENNLKIPLKEGTTLPLLILEHFPLLMKRNYLMDRNQRELICGTEFQ